MAESSPPPSGTEIAPGVVMRDQALRFRASRSSGPGGQNVNKVATKMHLSVDIDALRAAIGPAATERLLDLAGPSHVTRSGNLTFSSDESRSQVRNRQACLERLRELVVRAIPAPKLRRKRKVSKAAKARRVEAKRRQGQRKRERKPPP